MTVPSSSELASNGTSPVRRRWFLSPVLAAVAAVIVIAGLSAAQLILAIGGGGDPNARVAGWDVRRSSVAPTASGHQVLNDEWNERIASESFWRNSRRSSSNSSGGFKTKPSRLQGPPPSPSPGWFVVPAPAANSWGEPEGSRSSPRSSPRSYTGYRTICVRSCDGGFFPVSFSTSEGNLGRDQTTCSNACPGARLYYSRVHGDEIDDMVDLSGQRYSKLPNANLFKTQYVESCKCKPHAWEDASIERHRVYALEDRRRKGDRSVVAELEELKTKRQIEQRIIRGNRKSSRSRKKSDEKASLVPPVTVAASSVTAPAPRSDTSRGQGGPPTWQRYAAASVTTGSIGTQRTMTDTAALSASLPPAAHPSIGAATNAAADDSAVAAGAATASTTPSTATTVVTALRTEPAFESAAAVPVAPAEAAGTSAVKPVVAPSSASENRSATRRKTKARQQQARRQRPAGIMRLGAAPQVRVAPRPARAPQTSWVRQLFNQ
jgi:hypothetical protein